MSYLPNNIIYKYNDAILDIKLLMDLYSLSTNIFYPITDIA